MGIFINLHLNNAPHILVQWIKIWIVRWLNFRDDVVVLIINYPFLRSFSFVGWSRVMLKDMRPTTGYTINPGFVNCFSNLNVSSSIYSKTLWKKCGGITCTSLRTTPKTITLEGNFVCITLGSSEGSEHNPLSFILLILGS